MIIRKRNQKSKIKDQKDNNSKLKSQNSKLQLKTLKLSSCHPEGALSYCHPERSEGSHANSLSVILNEVKDPMPASRGILR